MIGADFRPDVTRAKVNSELSAVFTEYFPGPIDNSELTVDIRTVF